MSPPSEFAIPPAARGRAVSEICPWNVLVMSNNAPLHLAPHQEDRLSLKSMEQDILIVFKS